MDPGSPTAARERHSGRPCRHELGFDPGTRIVCPGFPHFRRPPPSATRRSASAADLAALRRTAVARCRRSGAAAAERILARRHVRIDGPHRIGPIVAVRRSLPARLPVRNGLDEPSSGGASGTVRWAWAIANSPRATIIPSMEMRKTMRFIARAAERGSVTA